MIYIEDADLDLDASEEDLLSLKEGYLSDKRVLSRAGDSLDTKIIGIKEELRKRKIQQLAELNSPKGYIRD